MKAIAYCALHYGAAYLAYAIRSVIDDVSEFWVLYSATGSHGHSTDHVCPDHAADLYAIAQEAAGGKLRWYTASPGQWRHEGEQRDYIHVLEPDADIVFVVDADEVYSDGLAATIIADYARAVELGSTWEINRFRLPMVHFWRSFHRCVTNDMAYPERVIFPKVNTQTPLTTTYDTLLRIAHFGYAQRSELVEYKQHTHGHKGEWRKDVDWYTDRWLTNAQEDVHPTNLDYWNPVGIVPLEYMPAFMQEHPYYSLEVIP